MPKIEITELDLTTPGSVMESTDVVFIPGFVDINQKNLNSNGEYIGIKANDPQLFTSLSAFETLCGTDAPVFVEDQLYPVNSDGTAMFSEKAIPDSSNNIFIPAGTPDPSYVMAKELLASGLPVLYQRINTDPDNLKVGYNAVSSATAEFYVGKNPVATDPDFYYKNTFVDATGTTVTEHLPYKNVVAFPDFSGFVTETGDPNVYKIEPLDYAKAVECYNDVEDQKFYVIDGKIVPESGLAAVGGSTNNATFKASILIKTVNNTYEYVADQKEVPNTLPETSDGSEYALAIACPFRPDDWSTNYSTYFESAPIAEGATQLKYVKIELLTAPSVKPYENGNIYELVDESDYSFTAQKMYDALDNIFSISDSADSDVSGLIDRGNHSVKYLTSGGYPVFECGTLANSMLKLAEHRGDCVALIDHTDHKLRKLNPDHPDSLYYAVKEAKGTTLEVGEFGAMFTPWAEYARITEDGNVPETPSTFRAPGSFAYLAALADSIKTNANWLAVAGVTRGGIKNLVEMTTVIPNGVADKVQPRDNISINAITNIKPYGYTIWGNRTLKDNAENFNLVATSFLNIRNLVSDIKKTCYRAARKLTFEQDTDVLWINFKAEISKLLDQMKSGYGISGYKIVRDNTHKRANDKATLCAKVIIYPIEAVEDFYITIVLKDDEVAVN